MIDDFLLLLFSLFSLFTNFVSYVIYKEDTIMKQVSYTQETLVIENPSKALVDFANKLRDRKMAQQKELRNKKDFYFPKSK